MAQPLKILKSVPISPERMDNAIQSIRTILDKRESVTEQSAQEFTKAVMDLDLENHLKVVGCCKLLTEQDNEIVLLTKEMLKFKGLYKKTKLQKQA